MIAGSQKKDKIKKRQEKRMDQKISARYFRQREFQRGNFRIKKETVLHASKEKYSKDQTGRAVEPIAACNKASAIEMNQWK